MTAARAGLPGSRTVTSAAKSTGGAPDEGVVAGDRVREPPALHDDRLSAVVQHLAGGDGHQQAHQGQVEHDVPALPQVAALRADRERAGVLSAVVDAEAG